MMDTPIDSPIRLPDRGLLQGLAGQPLEDPEFLDEFERIGKNLQTLRR